jgi:hypothetical protein
MKLTKLYPRGSRLLAAIAALDLQRHVCDWKATPFAAFSAQELQKGEN